MEQEIQANSFRQFCASADVIMTVCSGLIAEGWCCSSLLNMTANKCNPIMVLMEFNLILKTLFD